MNKKIISIVAVVIIIGAGFFYGGMKYGQRSGLALASQGNFRGINGGIGGARRGSTGGTGDDVASGEIISKDDKSITVKLRDGGSKIIFIGDSTQVMKSTTGTASDLAIGDQIMTFGTANADGSVTAKSIQIRPKLPPQ